MNPRMPLSATRERLYAVLVGHAEAGTVVPPLKILRQEIGCGYLMLIAALDAEEEAGRIRRTGGHQERCYIVCEIGKATQPARLDRPAAWNLRRDNNLTSIQRQTLSVARRIIRERGSVGAPELSREMGLNSGSATQRLAALSARGHLRGIAGYRYVAAEAKAEETLSAAGPRIEIRPEFPVPVKICPPAYADGALHFGTMLGKGGVALAGGGFQKSAGRP